jgi:hypothetical protein
MASQKHTKDVLADALREVGLTEMADKASTGYYHDFLSPLDFPEMQLEADLREARLREPDFTRKDAIEAVRRRHLNGDFDANTAESEEWFNGPEGRDAMNRLVSGA